MYNIVEILVRKELHHAFLVLEVLADETVGGIFFALSQHVPVDLFPANSCLIESCVLEVHIIVVVDVVKPDDLLYLLKKDIGKMKADEAGGAGYQIFRHVEER